MPTYRKGHEANSKATKRKIEKKQRRDAQQFLDGKKIVRRKKPPKKGEKKVKPSEPYPCGPKQLSLGEHCG